MKRALILLAAACVAAAPAVAAFGSLINSWSVPKYSGLTGADVGVAWDGDYIWCLVQYPSPSYVEMMYRCQPSNGSVVSSFDAQLTGTRYNGWGITYRLWNAQPCIEVAVFDTGLYRALLYRYDFNGSILDTQVITGIGANAATSVEFTGGYDYISNYEGYGDSYINKLSTSGSVLSSFKISKYGAADGLCKQGDFFWVAWEYSSSFSACKCTTTGSVVASFGVSSINRIYDCANEGNHLWVNGDDKALCYDVANAPAVEPASLGKVKALYR